VTDRASSDEPGGADRTVQVRLLGSVEVEAGGNVLPLGGPRAARLLAALVLNAPGVVSTDRLVDILWQSPPSSARQQIHNGVGKLRRSLAPARGLDIVTAPVGYRAELDGGRLDLARFRTAVRLAGKAEAAGRPGEAIEQLRTGLGLWRGPALSGLDGPYFDNVSARLDEDRLAAVERLMVLRVRSGDGALVLGELTELVSEHPLREAFRATLMTALYSSGRQADALAVYDQGRHLLAEEFGLDPSPDLRTLRDGILRGLPTPEPGGAHRDADAATGAACAGRDDAATPAGRCFLPYDPREFSGRARELLTLLDDSRQGDSISLVISAINGMGGIGKTALAVHFAHTVAEDYPDGQYFVDLRGFTIGVEPLTPSDALAALLRQCGLTDELIPADLAGRTAAWRARLAHKRALVLLDNATDEAQLRPLLPGASGPLVLVTSRRRLATLEGAVPVPLDLMPTDEAAALFSHIIGPGRLSAQDEAGIEQVTEYCGRLPLAVRIAASRFRDRRSWDVAYLVRLLSDQEQRSRLLDLGERSVSAVLELSYRYLCTDGRRMFRLLSIYPGADFTAPTAAALVGMSADRAGILLESLLDDNLLLQENPGRYRFHDLVRDCARRLCEEHETEAARQEARDRLLDYHLQCAAAWCTPLAKKSYQFSPDIQHVSADVPVPRSAEEAVEILRHEGANLMEVAAWSLAEGSAHHAWQMVCILQPYMRRIGYTGASLDLFLGALAAVRSIGDERGEALCLVGAALVHRERRENGKAQQLLEAALRISRRRADLTAEAYQLTELGVVMSISESLPEASEYYLAALAAARRIGDQGLGAGLKNNLGLVYKDLGRNAEAFAYLSEALSDYRAAGQEMSESYALLNLGALLNQQGDFVEAVDCLKRAEKSGRAGNLNQVVAAALAVLCVSRRALGDLDQCFADGRAALGIARDYKVLDMECEALAALGEAHLARGDLADADRTFRNALDLSTERDLRSYEGRAREGLAHLALHHGNIPEARRMFQYALLIHEGKAEAEYPRAHLAHGVPLDATCLRCVSGEP
jgi:DNA-binding SARP family transcriptional activator/tetratricopeptide (TPR) repeat protein